MSDIVIETEQLQLRQMTLDDVPALLKVFGDADAMRFYPTPFDEARTREWVNWNRRSYETRGHGLWALIQRSTGEVIGDCGLVSQEVDGSPEIEVGYHVRRDLWGKGLATEAAQACIDHGLTGFSFRRFVSLIHPQNVPSRRVAAKIGMTLRRETEWKGKATCIYGIERGRILAHASP
ncbi:MAG: GNAT family N-acetyltransferase [Verrucomicrobiaceae bacterium]|nr:GNAT family N-acetyltransferase [Verrucomicrobiaceae bacterium]